jgi:hypothetical protein
LQTFDLTTNFADGTVSVPSIAWTSDADGTGTGFYRASANTIAATISGTGRTEISNLEISQTSGGL